jgi:hypothetical protein
MEKGKRSEGDFSRNLPCGLFASERFVISWLRFSERWLEILKRWHRYYFLCNLVQCRAHRRSSSEAVHGPSQLGTRHNENNLGGLFASRYVHV